jgi:hypothetical protein
MKNETPASSRGTQHPRRVLLSRCAAAVAAAVIAMSAATQSTAPLSVVVVSASALPPGLDIDPARLPYTVQRATEAAQRESCIDEPGEFMVRCFTGVNVNEVQGNSLQNDVSFRGFRLSPTLSAAQGMSVYLDGVRANEPFGDVISGAPSATMAGMPLSPAPHSTAGTSACCKTRASCWGTTCYSPTASPATDTPPASTSSTAAPSTPIPISRATASHS